MHLAADVEWTYRGDPATLYPDMHNAFLKRPIQYHKHITETAYVLRSVGSVERQLQIAVTVLLESLVRFAHIT